MRNLFLSVIIISFFAACTAPNHLQQGVTGHITSLRLLDEYIVPYDFKYKNTWVGGLSGIDYDAASGTYYIISDERSATAPARFYTANIAIKNNKIDTVLFNGVHYLQQPNAKTFPSIKEDAVNAADPESIRYNPLKKNLIWSSEGDKAVRNGVMVVKNPSVFEMDTKGIYQDSLVLPQNLKMTAGEAGPRTNGVFEGITYSPDKKYIYVSVEEPLFEDGERAGLRTNGAPVRITKFDAATRKPIAQYAYILDAVANAPKPATAFSINGVPEIYCTGNDKLLVMERSFSTGVSGCTIKIFQADLSHATNIINQPSLKNNTNYVAATKKIILNMDDLHRYIDNVEGMTYGPLLPNGHQSLICIADNNFNPFEKTQVFLFEINP